MQNPLELGGWMFPLKCKACLCQKKVLPTGDWAALLWFGTQHVIMHETPRMGKLFAALSVAAVVTSSGHQSRLWL